MKGWCCISALAQKTAQQRQLRDHPLVKRTFTELWSVMQIGDPGWRIQQNSQLPTIRLGTAVVNAFHTSCTKNLRYLACNMPAKPPAGMSPEQTRKFFISRRLILSYQQGLTVLASTMHYAQFGQLVTRFALPLESGPLQWMLQHRSADSLARQATPMDLTNVTVVSAAPRVFMIPRPDRAAIWRYRKAGAGYPIWQASNPNDLPFTGAHWFGDVTTTSRNRCCRHKLQTCDLGWRPRSGLQSKALLPILDFSHLRIVAPSLVDRLAAIYRWHVSVQENLAPIPLGARALRLVLQTHLRDKRITANLHLASRLTRERRQFVEQALQPTALESIRTDPTFFGG